MDVTRRQGTNTPAGQRPGFGPPNEFHHIREFPAADFRAVVRPNFDTLYSSAWLDLTGGPVQVHIPDSGDRYYMVPMLDMWTDVFANPGKRTTGTGEQDYLIAAPGWHGDVPDAAALIHAPTPHVWIIARTQTNGPADYPNVHRFQDAMRISEVGRRRPHSIDPSVDITTEPLRQVNSMRAFDFFSCAATLLQDIPPHATDFSQLARLKLLGIESGRSFDPSRFSSG